MARSDIPIRFGEIPSQYENGFAKLISLLGSESAQELLEALKEVPPTIDYLTMTSELDQKVSTIPHDDVADIVFALLPLSTLQADLDTPASNIAESISREIERSDSESLKLTSEVRERFKGFLVELLSSPPLKIAGKARNLQLEDEHVFQEARIVTDIRPVFGDDAASHPEGAIIVHTLKLSYLDGNQFKNFYISIDARDARVLRNLLERADTKAGGLRNVLKAADVPHIDVREEEQ